MMRTQISLTEDQLNRLREEAQARRTSIAGVVREAVDEHLSHSDRDEAWDRLLAAAGCAKGGPRDLSINHDRYLAEALAE